MIAMNKAYNDPCAEILPLLCPLPISVFHHPHIWPKEDVPKRQQVAKVTSTTFKRLIKAYNAM